jgi:hypothetical protein
MGPADELEFRTFDRTVRTVLDAEQWRQTPVGGREALVRSVLAGVQPGWGQTRIDIRSASRFGRHDFGGNARRIQRFAQELQAQLDAR